MMLARRMGKTRIIAETGAGQHGVATATVAARFGLRCVIYMGECDIERQQPNVFRMHLLGAEVRPGRLGLAHAEGCDERGFARLGRQPARHVLRHRLGRRSASVSGHGARFPVGDRQRGERAAAGERRPAARRLVACVGGGSNAMGLFHPFLDDRDVRIDGVEAAGDGLATGEHAAAMTAGHAGHPARPALLSAPGR